MRVHNGAEGNSHFHAPDFPTRRKKKVETVMQGAGTSSRRSFDLRMILGADTAFPSMDGVAASRGKAVAGKAIPTRSDKERCDPRTGP